jgi:hypothetical protein
MSNFQNLGYFGDILFSKLVLEHNALIFGFSYFEREHNFVSIKVFFKEKYLGVFSVSNIWKQWKQNI